LITTVNVNRDYQIACSGFNIGDEQPDVQLLALLKSGSPTNIFGFDSPVIDGAIEKARQAKNDADEKAAFDEITKYFLEEAPAAIYHPGWEYIAWNKNVQGIKPTLSSLVLFDKAFIS
jgi:peptide/nickel transport system substrate-binding protein